MGQELDLAPKIGLSYWPTSSRDTVAAYIPYVYIHMDGIYNMGLWDLWLLTAPLSL